jgi:hypothetical protein
MVDPMHNLNLDDDSNLPSALKADLRDIYGSARPAGISRVDDAVLSAVRARFPRREKAVIATLGPRRWAWGLGAAAAAVILVVALNPFADKGPRNFQGPIGLMKDGKELQTGDINFDGKIDILDAYLLQRYGREISLWDDLTGDGKLDQDDVNALAAAAVKLGGPRL